jgi:PAS domain S-box-containing protein
VGITGVMTDITERKQAEEQLRQRNRELRLLNQVMATAATNPEAILEITCRELAATFDVSQVNVALLNERKTRVTVVAGYTAIDSTPRQAQEPPTTVGQAIPVRYNPALQYLLNQQKPLVINNGSEPRLASLRGLICQGKMAAALIVPLIHKGQVMGLLCLNDIRPRQFSSEEVSVVEGVAGQAAATLVRTKATQVQQRLATALEQSAESVMITDVRGYIVYVNPAFERVSGYSAAEVLGQKPHILKSDHQGQIFYQKMWSTITAGKVWRGRFVKKWRKNNFPKLSSKWLMRLKAGILLQISGE